MKQSIKKRISFGVGVFLCLLFLWMPHPVRAEIETDLVAYLEGQVRGFLTEAFQMSDAQLADLRSNGGFYQIFVDSWQEDREVTGALRQISEVTLEEGESLTARAEAIFENYEAEILLSFDPETYAPKNYVMNIQYSMREKMRQAAQNMIVGLIVVFAILIFLMFIIYLFRFLPTGRKKEPEGTGTAIASDTSDTKETPPASTVHSGTEEEVAAMVAAIAAATAASPKASGYTVRAIRRDSAALQKHDEKQKGR